jgi:hypothetical protein
MSATSVASFGIEIALEKPPLRLAHHDQCVECLGDHGLGEDRDGLRQHGRARIGLRPDVEHLRQPQHVRRRQRAGDEALRAGGVNHPADASRSASSSTTSRSG